MQAASTARMYRAVRDRDARFDGRFLVGVVTTGVFCRPTCPAPTPLSRNTEYFDSPRSAVLAGYRPCKRCRPLGDRERPHWLDPLLADVEASPNRRWRDRDLQAAGLEPDDVRAWFNRSLGLTFHAYARIRAASIALGAGERSEGARLDAFAALVGGEREPGDARAPVVADTVATPLGRMVAAATPDALCLLEFADRPMLRTQLGRIRRHFGKDVAPGRNRWIDQAEQELAEYFEGTRQGFTVPLATPGTPFQERVWNALRGIPYGRTWSYRELAAATGNPAAVRAVGKANGDNRIAVILPCHRVIGADGALTGYGGGLWRKEDLLALEAGPAS